MRGNRLLVVLGTACSLIALVQPPDEPKRSEAASHRAPDYNPYLNPTKALDIGRPTIAPAPDIEPSPGPVGPVSPLWNGEAKVKPHPLYGDPLRGLWAWEWEMIQDGASKEAIEAEWERRNGKKLPPYEPEPKQEEPKPDERPMTEDDFKTSLAPPSIPLVNVSQQPNVVPYSDPIIEIAAPNVRARQVIENGRVVKVVIEPIAQEVSQNQPARSEPAPNQDPPPGLDRGPVSQAPSQSPAQAPTKYAHAPLTVPLANCANGACSPAGYAYGPNNGYGRASNGSYGAYGGSKNGYSRGRSRGNGGGFLAALRPRNWRN